MPDAQVIGNETMIKYVFLLSATRGTCIVYMAHSLNYFGYNDLAIFGQYKSLNGRISSVFSYMFCYLYFSSNPALCPPGYIHFPGHHWILHIYEVWNSYMHLCQNDGGSLISLETPGELDAVRPWLQNEGKPWRNTIFQNTHSSPFKNIIYLL